jgi:hypothetical protein
MAKYAFTGDCAEYFPTKGIFAHRGDVYEWGEDTPPANKWAPADGSVTRVTNPAEAPVTAPEPAPAAEATDSDLKAAEAFLEANPALASKVLKEMTQNA